MPLRSAVYWGDSGHAVQACVGWIAMARDDIPGDLIRHAFRKCCILNTLEGTEDCALCMKKMATMSPAQTGKWIWRISVLVLNAIYLVQLFTICLSWLAFKESFQAKLVLAHEFRWRYGRTKTLLLSKQSSCREARFDEWTAASALASLARIPAA